jgi:catechol 2,3-dioxygenase-like lactoylglutathione lyase family enzyme
MSIRRVLVVLALACGWWTGPAAARARVAALETGGHRVRPDRPGSGATVQAVGAIGMTVRDMDRSVEFYQSVLSFQKVSDVEVAGDAYERLEGVFGLRVRIVRLQLGDEQIELTQYLAPEGRSIPEDSRSQDRWFQHVAIVVRDMDSAYAVLRAHHVRFASTGPQLLPASNPNAGGIAAFYFKDPDGHVLELIHFPSDKGRGKWHASTGRLFEGIDHTAIVVADTRSSVLFYRDLLGLAIVGSSENSGTEQSHLNNVEDARVRITSLRAHDGPGVELLEYLTPGDGRPIPADARANDLAHWQTMLVTDDADGAARTLSAAGVGFISPAAVVVGRRQLGFTKGLLVRDPDGHIMEVVAQ